MTEKRICPYCGKELELVGETLGQGIHDEIYPKVKYSYVYRNKFEKGRIWSYPQVPMFCGKCGVQIKLKSNPFQISELCFGLLCIIDLVFVIFFIKLWIYCLIFSAVSYAAVSLAAIIAWRRIKKRRSNFEFSLNKHLSIYRPDEYHSPVPTIEAAMPITGGLKTRKYLAISNIYSTEIAGSNAFLYLVSYEKKADKYLLRFRICGNYEFAFALTLRLKEHMTENGISVPLRFEGKYIGNVEVINIAQLSENCQLI